MEERRGGGVSKNTHDTVTKLNKQSVTYNRKHNSDVSPCPSPLVSHIQERIFVDPKKKNAGLTAGDAGSSSKGRRSHSPVVGVIRTLPGFQI